MNAFELFATLSLDSSGYDEGLNSAEEQGNSFASGLSSTIGTAAKVTGAAMAAVGTAAVAGTKMFADGITQVAAYGDNVDKTSQKLGISAEKFQQLDYVLNIAGSSMNSMQMGMRTLTNQLDAAKNGSESAIEKFTALGFSLEDIQNMSREDAFENVIYGFQGMEDSVERAALASDLLGRSSMELAPLFNMTEAETRALMNTATEYGMVLSDEGVKASAGFQDSLTTLSKTTTGLKNNLLSEFLPSLTTVFNGLSAVFAGDDSGLGQISEGVDNFIVSLNDVMPRVLEIGGRILTTLITSISSNLPRLLSEGSEVLSELVQGIIIALPSLIQSAIIVVQTIGQALLDNAELLLNTGLDLLLTLMNGITENLPTVIPAIVSVINMIVTTLTSPENLDAFIQGALALIMALADGIVIALPQLVEVIPTVIFNLIDAIINNFPQIIETVIYLIGALGYAVLKALGTLLGQTAFEITEALSGMFDKAFNFGKQIGAWLANGVNNIINSVRNFFTNIGNFFSNGFQNMKNKVTEGLDNIRNKFTSIFDNVRNVVKNAIDFIKNLFNFQWSLPKLKLPHFSVSGKLDLLASPPTFPTVSVDWYKKAMGTPYILNDATIFGAANGKLLGGGESGSEVVVGTNKLMSMMKKAVGTNERPVTINVYGAAGQDIRELAKEVSRELQKAIDDKEKVYA